MTTAAPRLRCGPQARAGALDTAVLRRYSEGRKAEGEGWTMLDLSKRQKPDFDERKIIFLEFVAAAAILSIVALVLYMIFTYKPA